MRFFALFFILSCLSSCREASSNLSRSIIDGVWETACLPNPDSGAERFSLAFFADNSLLRERYLYEDTACTQELGRIRHEGRFDLAVRWGDDLYDIDFTLHRVEAIAKSENSAELWRQQNFCGIAHYTAGSASDLTPIEQSTCGSYGQSPFVIRDVLALSPTDLSFGLDFETNIPRPSAIDKSILKRVYKPKG